MQLRITPQIGPRYWVAILIASACGTNCGDFLPGVLKFGTGTGLLILVALFSALLLAERLTRHGSEAFYWLAILVVRAAATNVADFSIEQAHLGYLTVSAVLAVLLVGLVVVRGRPGAKSPARGLPPTDGFYWFTMLTAGALGTVIGDGFAHAFGPVRTGAFISVGMATVALALILGVRGRMGWTSAASYWVAIVAVRWWGTNVGDILAFLVLGLLVSLTVTALTLAVTLLFWRERGTARGEARRPV